MNATEFKQYWQELAEGAGLSEDQKRAVSEVLGTDKVSAAFAEKFLPVSDHHRTLDKVKGESKAALDEAQQKAKQYEDWYTTQAKPAYDQMLTTAEQYAKYKELYGDLPGDGGQTNNQPVKLPDNVVTREDLDRIVAVQNDQFSNLWEKGFEFAAKYQGVTGKQFPASEFKKFALDESHRHLPMEASFEQFMKPHYEAKEKADREAWEKAKLEEIERNVMSRHNVPPDTKPSEPHPFFSPKPEKFKDLDNQGLKQNAKTGFLTGWGEGGATQ